LNSPTAVARGEQMKIITTGYFRDCPFKIVVFVSSLEKQQNIQQIRRRYMVSFAQSSFGKKLEGSLSLPLSLSLHTIHYLTHHDNPADT
jgi:hypothetical protein